MYNFDFVLNMDIVVDTTLTNDDGFGPKQPHLIPPYYYFCDWSWRRWNPISDMYVRNMPILPSPHSLSPDFHCPEFHTSSSDCYHHHHSHFVLYSEKWSWKKGMMMVVVPRPTTALP